MREITRWFLENPVAANLLMLFILVGGYLSLTHLRVETFPQIPPSQLTISTTYSGGTAQQVDEGITQRIEDAISGIPGIKLITSQSSRGQSIVTVKKTVSTDMDRLLEDIRNRVEGIVGFPSQAERPQIYRDEYTNLASFVIIYGAIEDDLLQEVANRVEKALKKHSLISQIQNLGKRRQELIIEPDIEKLQRYDISVDDLADKINQWSLEYRSGELKTARGNITLKGDGFADNILKLQNLPIIITTDAAVNLGEIASIKRGYEANDSIVRYQGESAIALLISTASKDNLLEVSQAINQVLDKMRLLLPEAVKLDIMADMAPYIQEQLGLLTTNAWQGLLIVLILLTLFLELKLAFWVALGIPVSLAGALLLMGLPIFNYSINDITLFGMILVLGILIDDGVVVGESIYTARQYTSDPKKAAWIGVESVAIATVFGVLTTIAAFLPMLWIQNELAKLLSGFSIVVIFALLFSLIESKLILPSHLCFSAKKDQNILSRILEKIRSFFTKALDTFSVKIYQPSLRIAIHHKINTLLLFSIIVLLGYGLLFKNHIRSVFFPEIPGRYMTVEVVMDQDAPLALNLSNVQQLETAIHTTSTYLEEKYQLSDTAIVKYITSVEASKLIELTAELSTEALNKVPSQAILSHWKQATGNIEGSYAVKFRLTEEAAGGTMIAISASSRDLARHIAQQIKTELAKLPGVTDVFDDSQGGKRQLQITLNTRGRQLGLSQRDLATLVGGAFGNLEIHKLLEKGEETTLLIRFSENNQKSIEQLQATPVFLEQDRYVSLGEIAHFTYSRAPEILYRRNRDEVVNVYWRQDRNQIAPEEVWELLNTSTIPELTKRYPEVTIKAVGEFDEISDIQSGFKTAMILNLLLIYILLAIPLKSYWQPLIILSVIPFGFAGAIFGHGLMGLPVSILSLFGMMAMTGVVINDSLVLMTRFNQYYKKGAPIKDALIAAGRSRMRAIFLTTVTTICGLIPLLLETSEQAQYLKPAAVSLVFGELFATPITLILIPVLLGFGKYKKIEPVQASNAKK